MKKMKKILSVAVGVLFLVNNLSLADVLNVKGVPNEFSFEKLATESRLAPLNTPELLDIMKLTAGIMHATAGKNLAGLERNVIHKIDRIGKGAVTEIRRPNETLSYDLRSKRGFNKGDVIFFPCSIEGLIHGTKIFSKRYYLCYAKKIAKDKYDFDFYSQDKLGISVGAILYDDESLTKLVKWTRAPREKEGIARFAEQQNETDVIIREAILDHKEQRLSFDIPWVKSAHEFLSSFDYLENTALSKDFETLVNLGQLMLIPGLEKPHAGGIGIYLPTDTKYHNPQTLLHEIFAKCGFTDKENKIMETIYASLTSAVDTEVAKVRLDKRQSSLFEKATVARFAHRLNEPLTVDYYKKPTVAESKYIEIVKDKFAERFERMKGEHSWYLGIDSSTQSVTFNVIDFDTKEVIWSHREKFDDEDYKKLFATIQGVLPHDQAPEEYHTDPLMLAAALDRGMAELKTDFESFEWRLDNIRAISGAGQQHGTVYYNKEAQAVLKELNPDYPLWKQLQEGGIFSRLTAPIWQDGTTVAEVEKMEEVAGGASKLRKLTGSAGTLRFSLAQIMAFFKRHLSAYEATHTVLNIAAYNGSLLTGKVRFPFDPGDGAGTNAMHLTEKSWLTSFINKLAPGLSTKLTDIKPSDQVIGGISPYWVKKYGFSPLTQVVNWTGDNPSAMTGQGIINKGQVTISLGTSYTMYTFLNKGDLKEALKVPIGHVFGEPTGKYMKLVCFQNGDLTLAKLRDQYISDEEAIERVALLRAGNRPTEADLQTKRWKDAIYNAKIDIFTDEIRTTPVGNNGAMMIAQHKTEDVVKIPLPEKPYARSLDFGSRAQVFRAAVEGQMYFLKYIADEIGLDVKEIKLTGGVANNPVVRQIMADVFNAKVTVLKDADAVSLGSAIRAMKAHRKMSWKEAIKGFTDIDEEKTALPSETNVKTYGKYFEEYKNLLQEAIVEAETDTTEHVSNEKIINYITKRFNVTPDDMLELVDRFHSEMDKGLRGEESSLAMIPSYVEPATGEEKGTVITIDFGGTNLRIWRVELLGKGEMNVAGKDKFVIPDEYKKADQEVLFGFLAECIEEFLDKQGMDKTQEIPISFIFSFPTAQSSINSGIITEDAVGIKEFLFKGAVGKDVVRLLKEALAKRAMKKVKVVALANDTVGTEQALRYSDANCDSGVIMSSGTNGCLTVRMEDIFKAAASMTRTPSGEMIVNMEWGNFDKLVEYLTPYDTKLDRSTLRERWHLFEKMSSGMYITEVTRLVLLDLVERKMLFEGRHGTVFSASEEAVGSFVDKWMATIIGDNSSNLRGVQSVLKKAGIKKPSIQDKRIVKEITDTVATRSAQLCAAAIAATITYKDRDLDKKEKYTVSLDSKLYLYNPGYAQKVEAAIKGILGERAKKIKLVSVEDVTGMGAAVIGAVAYRMAQAEKEKISTTIIDAAAGEVTQYMKDTKTVIFIPQDFATEARCTELAKEFAGAEFKTFNQHTGLDKLPGHLQWYGDRDYKIGIIGMGLDFGNIKNIIRRNQDAFKDVLAINVGAEGVSELIGERRKSFQKGILTIALLARALPKEGYKETRSYMTLRSLLGMVLPGKFDVDTYIENLVNTDISVIERFGYVINAMLTPIVPMDYEKLRHVVDIFISA